MDYSGINSKNVKISNRSAILNLLNDRGAMSRKDIALELGVTPAAVTMICTELITNGVLVEKGEAEEEKRAGRKKILVDINYSLHCVLTICIEAEVTTISVCDLSGKLLAQHTRATEEHAMPAAFLQTVAAEAKALLWESGAEQSSLLGVGVSVPGLVDRAAGISRHSYRIWDKDVPVAEILERELRCPVIVENNVKAFAEGELVYGRGKDHENLLFIKWGPGVGSALIVRSRIYQGRDSGAAEIGHCVVKKHGKLCRCGRRGCLETEVSTHAIAERVRALCTEERMPRLYQLVKGDLSQIQARNISWWMEAQDEGLKDALSDIVELMAMSVTNIGTILAPDKVILFGYIFNLPHMEEWFTWHCRQYDPVNCSQEGYIEHSRLSDRANYIGPLAIVVNELFLMSNKANE